MQKWLLLIPRRYRSLPNEISNVEWRFGGVLVLPSSIKHPQERFHCPKLPLAVYREVAAHLQQVPGVEVEFIPQTSQQFDYTQSQIDSLTIRYGEDFDVGFQERVKGILNYYSQRYDN